MIPYSYSMVDMGGIDLAEANRTVVEGLYNRLAIARNACGDLILYNWKFAEIEIAPGICSTLDEGTSIVINGLIQVTEQDEVTVLGIAPPPVPVEPLTVTSNGVYVATPPTSGFNPVSVNVPIPRPRIIPIVIEANGKYTPPSGVDGFGPITVNVEGASSMEVIYNIDVPNVRPQDILLEKNLFDYDLVILSMARMTGGASYSSSAYMKPNSDNYSNEFIFISGGSDYLNIRLVPEGNSFVVGSQNGTWYVKNIIGFK